MYNVHECLNLDQNEIIIVNEMHISMHNVSFFNTIQFQNITYKVDTATHIDSGASEDNKFHQVSYCQQVSSVMF